MSRKKPRGESHVRLYAHELACPAWQTLDPDGRALLVELRALYQPRQGPFVFLSVRECMRRLGIGQRRAQAAFAVLLERGWIEVATPSNFDWKAGMARQWRLTNEPGANGHPPPKPYMRWQPTDIGHEKTR